MLGTIGYDGARALLPDDVGAEAAPHQPHARAVEGACFTVPAAWFTPAVREALTLALPPKQPQQPPPKYPIYTTRAHSVQLPRLYGRAVFGDDARAHDLTAAGADMVGTRFEGALRPLQRTAVDATLGSVRRCGGGILNAACGAGKTAMAIWMACALGRRTVVLLHKSSLLDQWKERIHQFAPDATVGVVQQAACDDRCDFVLVMLQTVLARQLRFPDVGTLVVDECHHICAKTFSRSLAAFPARHRIGLSATLDRADGLGYALKYLMGPVAIEIRRKTTDVDVRFLRPFATTQTPPVVRDRRGEISFTAMVTNLVRSDVRNAAIVDAVLDAFRDGKATLVVSERRNHLETLRGALLQAEGVGADDVGMYVGETTKRGRAAREAQRDRSILLGTYGMTEEGLDIPRLGVVVLATPRASATTIEQVVGRILRPHPSKTYTPTVVDVDDGYSVFCGMARKRRRMYTDWGFHLLA